MRSLGVGAALFCAACLTFDVQPRTNHLPVAKVKVVSITPGVVVGGTLVTLDASESSDEDGDPLEFRFSQVVSSGSDAVAISGVGALATFEAPRRAQTLLFTLVVSDGLGDAPPLHVPVEVSSLSRPVARAGEDVVAALGQTVVLDASASFDTDGDPLAYQWTRVSGDPEVQLAAAEAARTSFIAPQQPARYLFRLEVTDGRFSSTDDVEVEIRAIPLALISANVAGSVQQGSQLEFEIAAGAHVALKGDQSVPPPGGDIDEYKWTAPSELGVEAAALASSEIAFDVPLALSAGFTVRLSVSSNVGGSRVVSPDARVVFKPAPQRPVARARATRDDVLNKTPVRLDGTSSSPDAVYFCWNVRTAPPGGGACVSGTATACKPEDANPCLSGADTPSPIFTPPARGDYTVRLIVSSAAHVDSLPTFLVVSALNNRPRADAGPDLTTPNKAPVALTAAYTDADGDVIDPATVPNTSFRWEVAATPPGATYLLEDASKRTAHFTPNRKGAYTLDLIVNDGLDASDPDPVAVIATNTPPVARPLTPVSGPNLSSIALNAGATTDPDGDPLTYTWTLKQPAPGPGTFSDQTASAPNFRPQAKGAFTITLAVDDGEASHAADVALTSLNNPPVADAGGDQSNVSSTRVLLSGGLSHDPDGDPLTSFAWRLASGPPLAAALGMNTAAPDVEVNAVGTYVFGLKVSDGADTSAEDFVTVEVTDINHPPVVSAGPDQVVDAGQTVTLAGSAQDVDNDAVTSFLWTRLSNHPALPAQLVGASPTFAAPSTYALSDSAKNEIVYQAEATDARRAVSRPDAVSIFVAPPSAEFVFAGPGGTDAAGCGPRAAPCRSLAWAVRAAAAQGKDVLVGGGAYPNVTRSLVVPYGMRVQGGYDPTSWKRDPDAFISEIQGVRFPAEVQDLFDNDCDGEVDEAPVPGGTELCNHFDDDGDGEIDEQPSCDPAVDYFEQNDTTGAAKQIEIGRLYSGMLLHLFQSSQATDWYKFTLPQALPADPDGGGPETADLVLRLWWKLDAAAPTDRLMTLTLYGPNSGTAFVAQMQCTNECVGVPQFIDVAGLAAGLYYLKAILSPLTGGGAVPYDMKVSIEPTSPRPDCAANATVYVPPAVGIDPEDVPVIEGFRIRGMKGGVQIRDLDGNVTSDDNYPRAVLCEKCAMDLRGNRIWADGSETASIGGECAAVHVRDTPVLPGEPFAVRIEDNEIRIGSAWSDDGLELEAARDVLVRGNTFLANVFSPNSQHYKLIRTDLGSTGSKRGRVEDNTFVMEGSSALESCDGAFLIGWTGLRFANNVFDVRANCGGAGSGVFGTSAFYLVGQSGQQLVVANNAAFAAAAQSNKTVFLRERQCNVNNFVTARNNSIEGFDRVFWGCDGPEPALLAQWNALHGNDDAYANNDASTVLAESGLAAAQGKIGPHPESDGNMAVECDFTNRAGSDLTPAPGSPCVDAGGLSRPVPDGYATTADLATDALGAARTKDLSTYLNAPAGDGTDIGPVERQAP